MLITCIAQAPGQCTNACVSVCAPLLQIAIDIINMWSTYFMNHVVHGFFHHIRSVNHREIQQVKQARLRAFKRVVVCVAVYLVRWHFISFAYQSI